MAKSIEPDCDRQGSGIARPDEHPRLGNLRVPAHALETANQRIAPQLILGDLGQPPRFAMPQRHDRRRPGPPGRSRSRSSP